MRFKDFGCRKGRSLKESFTSDRSYLMFVLVCAFHSRKETFNEARYYSISHTISILYRSIQLDTITYRGFL